MRDLLLLVIVLGSVPVVLFRPFWGLVLYSWLAYMRPHDMVWQDLPQLSLIIAIATLAGMVLSGDSERWLTPRKQTLLLIAFGVWMAVSAVMARQPTLSVGPTIEIEKMLLIAVLTTGLVNTRDRFRILFGVIAVSLGLLGLKYGLYAIVRGGARIVEGPGHLDDNNGFALALNMAIPLLVAIALTERHKLVRLAAVTLALFSFAAIIFTFSRGGLLTLGVVAVMVLFRSRRPIAALTISVLGVLALAFLTTSEIEQEYLNRASTIQSYDEDESAMGRIREWGTAIRVFSDNPVFGVGPDNLRVVRNLYVLDGSKYKTTHNTYLQLLVAGGLPALLIFLATLGISYRHLDQIRKTTSMQWAEQYATMLQCSFVAYLLGSSLLDSAYFDLIYQLIGLTVALDVVVRAAERENVDLQMPKSPASVPWWQGSPASENERHAG